MTSVLSDVLRLVLWPSTWSTLENVPGAREGNLRSAAVGWNGLQTCEVCVVLCSWESPGSSCVCLDVPPTTEGAVLRCPTVTTESSFSLQSCQFLFRVF